MPNSNLFQNRSGTNLNRRKLTIISQSANEMIVDVERADNVKQVDQGTILNADVMNGLDDRIIAAETNSLTALSTANGAAQTVQSLASQIGERGAIVKVNGVSQTEVNFSSDPQTQINSKVSTSELFNLIYPVGSIYISINSTNPEIFFGGNWIAWGEGRVPIGVGNNGETNYTSAEMTGGSENSVAQHNHTQNPHSHQVLTNNIWSNVAAGLKDNVTGAGNYVTRGIAGVEQSEGTTGYRNISSSNEQYIQNTTALNNSQGVVGGNRQPFMTCYMWKRIL